MQVIEVEFLGIKKAVQPVCPCEAEAMKQEEIARANYQEHRKIRELFSLSDLGEKFLESSFDKFLGNKGTENALKFSQRYVKEFDSDLWKGAALLLWGVPGNGKSLLAASVANALESKGKTVVFISMPNLLQKIRSTFNQENNKETEHEIMKALHTCDLLVLDDIGAEKVTDWVEDVIFRIVDGRYVRKKPIFVTSNLSPDDLYGKIGHRSMDRLTEMCQPIHNQGTSYRKIIAQQRLGKILEN
ncbi:DnaC-like helicase loader [Bacillus phage Palmer]|uniref:DNA replication protein DnaC n=1 Tax=Bacillus phage Palmer TaxID=1597966 RepID=A0A0C5ACF6_9CAUD|nr:DnaC-like helicase loader [Bacillus phage Palmer]AJK28106.1 DNA replication protein DnaC [Bacillus phage Palmer]